MTYNFGRAWRNPENVRSKCIWCNDVQVVVSTRSTAGGLLRTCSDYLRAGRPRNHVSIPSIEQRFSSSPTQ
jgi:hypothetical protein